MLSLQHYLIFILDIFYVFFFVDCDKSLSSSSNPPYRNKNDFYIEIKTLQQRYSRSYGTASVV
jgi:hypothetical protein